MKVLIIGALPESLINFRGQLIKDIAHLGHDVVAIAAPTSTETQHAIESLGCRFESLPIQRNGLNPFTDIKTLIKLFTIFKLEQPDVILSYTIKPVIWGGIAATFFKKAKFFALITGLGFAFQKGNRKRNIIRTIVKQLYKISLRKCEQIIFQNKDNLNTFVNLNIIKQNKASIIDGSGVDTNHYAKSTIPKDTPPTFLTIARLLGDKGIREFAEAAKEVKYKYPEAKFQILGPEDPSPDGIPISEVRVWHNLGHIEYLEAHRDVRPFINNCHIFVLASYHEGMPRTVLEAMSIGRPILTTDVPGCRETVIEGENGFLVPKCNIDKLSSKMIWFIENPVSWKQMGDKSYHMVQQKFSIQHINKEILNTLNLVPKNV